MVITLDEYSTEGQINDITKFLKTQNIDFSIVNQMDNIEIVINNSDSVIEKKIEEKFNIMLPKVTKLINTSKGFRLITRASKSKDSLVNVNNNIIGGKKIVIIAGPCSIKTEGTLFDIASNVKTLGCNILRGGAFKPRTSPYSFQGLGNEGLQILLSVKEKTGLSVITELMDISQIERVSEVADIIQIGSRNMYNYSLLKEVGKCKKPVLLKRGFCATVNEWLMAAEYILKEGNKDVILCERGIRTFEDGTRNTLDLSAIVQVKKISHLPVIVDPSHGTGRRELIIPMSRAAIAAGADGLLIETDVNPDNAISDSDQTISIKELGNLISEVQKIAEAVGRRI